MSLNSRIRKVEEKLSPVQSLMIFVSNNETVKNALDDFNKAHGTKLSEKEVAGWRTFPFESNDGYFLLSPTWCIEDMILQMEKEDMEEKKNAQIQQQN